ncbi:MAG: aminotransferase class V-fold PLP-dependent enzyme [Proteobacteria bacterium]|nr:aminotransferase class V-fold PLP-dependent enzyme [Pseudomonadota bacterium]
MSTFDDGFGLILPKAVRSAVWQSVSDYLESYLRDVPSLSVASRMSTPEINEFVNGFDFKTPRNPVQLVGDVAHFLSRSLLHTSHPAYFGVFNPAPSTMGIAADALVAAFNPQLASSASAEACIAIETHLIRYFSGKFGYPVGHQHGHFTSGGTAANHTALLCALSQKLKAFAKLGVASAKPVIYVSTESHHSILRASRLCGLGTDAVVELPVDEGLRLDVGALKARVALDRRSGKLPLFLVATLGATSSGVFDDLTSMADFAKAEDLWLHADAAWGGAAIMLEEFESLFAQIDAADSITLDAHKWLSVPMGAGIFLTRHREVLEATFRVDQSPYMPGSTYDSDDVEPYKQSMEWSRRFTGLKLFMTLATHGEAGYCAVLRHQVAMGEYLRKRLMASGWRIVNQTPLPVVCFVDPNNPGLNVEDFASRVAETGLTWITPTRIQHTGQHVLRAGIANFSTAKEHIDILVDTLQQVREA